MFLDATNQHRWRHSDAFPIFNISVTLKRTKGLASYLTLDERRIEEAEISYYCFQFPT